MAGLKKKRDNKLLEAQSEHVHLQIESVLRLRPLLKKEKTDQIVLEPRRMKDGRPSTAVIHPMLAKQQKQHPESPAMKMLSPETYQLCKDTEYHLHQILAEESDQEKVYYSLGLPIARESMDYLKYKTSAKGVKRTSNLIICMGVEHSGKSHTCFGGAGNAGISKRRASDDGLVPRIIDSLFSQSKHHVKNRRNLSFALRVSLVQVTQQKTDQPKHDDDSVVYDLLLPSLSKAVASPLRSPSPTRLTSVKSLIATMERARGSATSSSSNLQQSDARVTIDQDTTTMDFTTNAIIKSCKDATETRQIISSGLHAGQKLCSRDSKAHVLTILQPVLFASDGSVEREGGKIGMLDMAGIDQSCQRKRNTALRRNKDSVGASTNGLSDSALNAVMHCVRSLQHNSMILSGKTPALDIVDGIHDGITIDDNTSEISCVSQEKTGKAKGPTFKVVPYRQHKLTMLLQPFFSARQTSTTQLTLLMAAYPGHRDHAEKKALLNDLELLFEVAREPETGAAFTGLEKKRPLSPIKYSPSSEYGEDDQSAVETLQDTNRNLDQKPRNNFTYSTAPTVVVSLAYSLDEEEDMIPMPPPFAPSAPPAEPHPVPNAPDVVDFPGVVMPTPKESPYDTPRSILPHPEETERSFEKTPPHIKKTVNKSPRDELPLRETTSKHTNNTKTREVKNGTPPTKAWLTGLSGTTKSAIHHVVNASAKKGMKMMDKMRPERTDTHYQDCAVVPAQTQADRNLELVTDPLPPVNTSTSEKHDLSSAKPTINMRSDKLGTIVRKPLASNLSSPTRKMGSVTNSTHVGSKDATQNLIKKLITENKDLQSRNRELEVRCTNLSAENKDLKRRLKAGEGRKPWGPDEEAAWAKTRKSFAAPTLIPKPLSEHLAETTRVFGSTGRHNTMLDAKPQFQLSFPRSFQRAPELDRRDRREEEKSKMKSPDISSVTQEPGGSGGKRKQNSVDVFQKKLESVKRRKNSLSPAMKDPQE